jgi:hypothetical protein
MEISAGGHRTVVGDADYHGDSVRATEDGWGFRLGADVAARAKPLA